MVEKNNLSEEKHTAHHDDHSNLDLRGTLMMVLFLGGLILVSWFGAFMLFMGRM